MTVGQIDYHLFTPWQPAERWLCPPLSDFLAEWSKTGEPSFAAIRIVGRQWEPRSHQLRDMLARIAMPTGSTRTTRKKEGGSSVRPARTAAACQW
jgi:hypothetical protein